MCVCNTGTVNIVNPLELVRQIRVISQNPVIATNVKTSLFAHRHARVARVFSLLALSVSLAISSLARRPGG